MKSRLIVVWIALWVGGCTISQNVDPVAASDHDRLCIIRNPEVRDTFLESYKSALAARQIESVVIERGDDQTGCDLLSTYRANWSWDLALYMSYCEIEIFRDRQSVGKALYDSTHGGGNMSKFISADDKVRELVGKLFSGTSP